MKNIDKIEIKLSIKGYLKDSHIEASLYINDSKVDYYISIQDFLLLSKFPYDDNQDKSHSWFFPFNCSCGDAGCNGLFKGIHSKHRKHTVEWRIPKGTSYSFLKKSFYCFSTKQYEEQIYKIWKFMFDNPDLMLRYQTLSSWQEDWSYNEMLWPALDYLDNLVDKYS